MKPTHIVALVLIAVSMGVIIATTFDFSSFETFDTAHAAEGKEFHVKGELVRHKPMHYDPLQNADHFSFYLRDKAGIEKKVIYPDPKPQDFERAQDIVVVGKMQGDEFHASKILMKCPSKYIDGESEIMTVTAGT